MSKNKAFGLTIVLLIAMLLAACIPTAPAALPAAPAPTAQAQIIIVQVPAVPASSPAAAQAANASGDGSQAQSQSLTVNINPTVAPAPTTAPATFDYSVSFNAWVEGSEIVGQIQPGTGPDWAGCTLTLPNQRENEENLVNGVANTRVSAPTGTQTVGAKCYTTDRTPYYSNITLSLTVTDSTGQTGSHDTGRNDSRSSD